MRRRWAVGLNLGGMSLTVDGDESATETQFSTGELSIRYRATPRFELELLLSGGRQVLEDGEEGDLAMGGGTLAARYRFRAEHRWNWWLMGGLGMTVIERHDSTDEQRDSAGRAHVAFGIGLERRFHRFAIHAELRGVAMGAREDAMEVLAAAHARSAHRREPVRRSVQRRRVVLLLIDSRLDGGLDDACPTARALSRRRRW